MHAMTRTPSATDNRAISMAVARSGGSVINVGKQVAMKINQPLALPAHAPLSPALQAKAGHQCRASAGPSQRGFSRGWQMPIITKAHSPESAHDDAEIERRRRRCEHTSRPASLFHPPKFSCPH